MDDPVKTVNSPKEKKATKVSEKFDLAKIQNLQAKMIVAKAAAYEALVAQEMARQKVLETQKTITLLAQALLNEKGD